MRAPAAVDETAPDAAGPVAGAPAGSRLQPIDRPQTIASPTAMDSNHRFIPIIGLIRSLLDVPCTRSLA